MTLIGCSDVIACVRELVLGLGSTATAAALSYAFYRRLLSSHGHSKRDLLVIGLSIVQTSLSAIYYTALMISWIFLAATTNFRFTHFVCASAAVQVILLYSFLIAIWVPTEALCRDTTWVLISIAWFMVSLLVCLGGLRLVRSLPYSSTVGSSRSPISPSPIADDASEDDENAVRIIDGRSADQVTKHSQTYQCLANPKKLEKQKAAKPMSVGHEPSGGRLIIRDLAETFRILPARSVELNETTSIDDDTADHQIGIHDIDESASAVVIGCTADLHENSHYSVDDQDTSRRGSNSTSEGTTQLDVKKNHLLALIGIETVAAGITMIWDVIIWFSVAEDEDSNTCNHFLSHIPVVEAVVYILSRAVALLVPHWAVFFVLYWLDRDLHRPYNPHWDVDMRSVELENLASVPQLTELNPSQR